MLVLFETQMKADKSTGNTDFLKKAIEIRQCIQNTERNMLWKAWEQEKENIVSGKEELKCSWKYIIF